MGLMKRKKIAKMEFEREDNRKGRRRRRRPIRRKEGF